jgi:hypothetical protein
MKNESVESLLSTLGSPSQGTVVESQGGVGDRLFENAGSLEPAEFRRLFNKRVDSLAGFSAQRAPKAESTERR